MSEEIPITAESNYPPEPLEPPDGAPPKKKRGCYSGDPITGLTPFQVGRFWSKVQKSEGCWEWQGNLNGERADGTVNPKGGYGKILIAGVHRRASRVAWTLTHGEIPPRMTVRHKCDNRLCVRPDHLQLGTQKQNVADAIARGTHIRPVILSPRQIEMIAEMVRVPVDSLNRAIVVAKEFLVKGRAA